MRRLVDFVKLSRPHFLAGGVLMTLVGVATAPTIAWGHFWVAQLMVSFAQITAHYVNEYADYEADLAVANRTSFSGGSGVLVAGRLDRAVALNAALVTSFGCIVFAALTATFSVAATVLGIAALAVSWAYSMPPVRLLATGVGELTTAITVAGLVPLIGALSQTDSVAASLWAIIAVLTLTQLAMLLAFELPDLDSDARTGKTVLGVRLGRARTLQLIGALLVTAVAVVLAQHLSPWGLLGMPLFAVSVAAAVNRHHRLGAFGAVAGFFLSGLGFLIALQ